MPPKKGHVGRKYKGQTKDTNLCAAKAASDDAVANTGLNPSPMGRGACRVVSGGRAGL